ncbi:MAG: hypothetical protein COB50_00755 [Thiotrichales bacterium]|nr:MAG: hypothetical protein COB50_00755 [Thiotrichales bacterium]
MSILSAALMLFLLIDPLGNIPVLLSILKRVPAARRRKILIRETGIALAILIVFLLFGRFMLKGMHLTPDALGIAGGIVLFLMAIKMIFPESHETKKESVKEFDEPFIVPIATPLLAGPSTLTIIILLTSQHPHRILSWLIALILAWSVCTAILLCSDLLRKILKERGLMAIERLMGLILVTMATQMFLNGIKHFFSL